MSMMMMMMMTMKMSSVKVMMKKLVAIVTVVTSMVRVGVVGHWRSATTPLALHRGRVKRRGDAELGR